MKTTHCDFYAQETDVPVKDSFKRVGDYLSDLKDRKLVLGDIGCAIGEFPNYLSGRFENFEVRGYEYSDILIEEGRARFKHLSIQKCDASDPISLKNESLDIITMLGTLGIFDDYEKVLENCLNWLKPKGRLVVHNMFNHYDLDVFIKYKRSTEPMGAELENGWHIPSMTSVGKFLERYGVADYKFHDFEISVDLEERPEDRVRSWTEKTVSGARRIVNGLCIQQPQKFLVVNKK